MIVESLPLELLTSFDFIVLLFILVEAIAYYDKHTQSGKVNVR